MGVFEFVIVLVLIITAGDVIKRVQQSRLQGNVPQDGELDRLRDDMGLLSGRVERLEEERDFYKKLLDEPREQLEISPPQEDPSP